MRKARILLILGVWIAVLPYLGFPYSWKDILSTISGLALICLSYVFYREYQEKETEVRTFDNFSENKGFIVGTSEEDAEMLAEEREELGEK